MLDKPNLKVHLRLPFACAECPAKSLHPTSCQLIAMPPIAQFVKGDLQSGDLLSYVLRSETVDTVLHFAAQVWGPLQR